MIKTKLVDNKRFEVSWETGAEYQFLMILNKLIVDRNNKEELK